MSHKVYIVEDYDSGELEGFWDKTAAIDFMIKAYIESDFGHIKDAITDAINKGDTELALHYIDTIKEDFETAMGNCHYIDCFIGMREVEVN